MADELVELPEWALRAGSRILDHLAARIPELRTTFAEDEKLDENEKHVTSRGDLAYIILTEYDAANWQAFQAKQDKQEKETPDGQGQGT